MATLSEEIALRIALAARALPDTAIGELLSAIIALTGDPITTGKLNKLRFGKLKQVPNLSEIDDEYLKQALSFLKGRNIECEPEPLPTIEAYDESSMPGSIRVACASNSGDMINGHFGSCSRFLIYQVSSNEARLIAIRTPGPVADDADKNALRAQLIDDCQMLYTISVGGPAAAKVVRAGLHPIKLPQGGQAPEVLERLRATLAGSPPPWLAKVMGQDPQERVRFREEANG